MVRFVPARWWPPRKRDAGFHGRVEFKRRFDAVERALKFFRKSAQLVSIVALNGHQQWPQLGLDHPRRDGVEGSSSAVVCVQRVAGPERVQVSRSPHSPNFSWYANKGLSATARWGMRATSARARLISPITSMASSLLSAWFPLSCRPCVPRFASRLRSFAGSLQNDCDRLQHQGTCVFDEALELHGECAARSQEPAID
jgi:hypothetical protein